MRVLLEGGDDPVSNGGDTGLLRGLHPEAGALQVPNGPDALPAHYDLTISHPAVEVVQMAAFERWLAGAAARHGLSCALIHDGVVGEVLRRLDDGRLTVGYHLDYFALWHVPGDPYARLAQAVLDAGGWPVNHPGRARLFTDKAAAHGELARHGIGVPETVIVQPGAPDRPLTAAEWSRLGLGGQEARIYVKPANGFGNRDVVHVGPADANAVAAALAAARATQPHEAFLVQREVRCPRLEGDDGVDRPAYWRILCQGGECIPFWWSVYRPEEGRPSYRRLSAAEVERYRLWPVFDCVEALAQVAGLDWFSTELCLAEGPEQSRFSVRPTTGAWGRVRWPVVAIDYVNDQCDVDVQSRWPGAPPDDVVRYLAGRFADAAARQRPTVLTRRRRPTVRRAA